MGLKKRGHVVLKVRDPERAEVVYSQVLGLADTGRLPGRMVFFRVPGHEDSHDLRVWKVAAEARPPEATQVGLFHVAWQVEWPEELEDRYRDLVARGVRVLGTGEHGPTCPPTSRTLTATCSS
jgi:catechol-2,3-dioxygenase